MQQQLTKLDELREESGHLSAHFSRDLAAAQAAAQARYEAQLAEAQALREQLDAGARLTRHGEWRSSD